jgi:hypothetical protein
MADENILVEFDYQNITVIDPNKVIDNNNEIFDRVVDQEELVMYANLEAKMIPRTKLAVGRPLDDQTQNVDIASINFMRPGGYDFLTADYYDEFTGKETLQGKGLNQKANSTVVIQQEKKPAEYYLKQNVINNQDTNLLGIESITINNDRSNTPTVDMVLTDIQGRALFEKGDLSPYAAFFNLPYPPFYLTIKGYYGKAVKYQLNLVKFSAQFDGGSGNYKIFLKFYSYKFTVLAETTLSYLFALPFMYQTKYEISANPANTPQQNSALTSVGNNNQALQSKLVYRGRQKMTEVYSQYKEQKLIPADFPELTLYELMQRLDALETNILASFGQVDFSPLTNIDSYFTLLNEYRNDITGTGTDAFFGKYMDQKNFFVDNLGRNLYVLQKQYETPQSQNDALTRLKSIVENFNRELGANPTCGVNGTYEVFNQKVPSSITNSIDINDFLVTPNEKNIDFTETYIQRNGSVPTATQLLEFKNQLSLQIALQAVNFRDSSGNVVNRNQFFVFEGTNSFDFLITKMFNELTKLRQEVELVFQRILNDKLEGPNGLGFQPTIRNLFAVIFASVEGFYRLMDDVHRNAWDRRFNKFRQTAILAPDKTSISSDAKDTVPSSLNLGVNPDNPTQTQDVRIPVYPWPQYFAVLNEDGQEKYELRYPGDPRDVGLTKGNDFYIWPEVEFVEEFLKGYSVRLQTTDPNGDSNESETILRISLNSVEFPMSNIPYTDKEEVKYFYEIYERILMGAYFERLSKDGGFDYQVYKVHSDLEATNIIDSLGESNPYISKKLKEYAISGGNYLQFLQTISNQGTGLNWQSYIRGLYNTRYIRGYVEKDYSVSSYDTLKSSTPSTSQNANSLDNVRQYLASSRASELDLLDVAPFTNLNWSETNLSNGTNDAETRYNTNNSLNLNSDKKMLSNYDVTYTDNFNRPYTNYDFLEVETPVVSNFDTFYDNRYINKTFLPTEGRLQYPANSNRGITNLQTVSMLNTPYFINALQKGVTASKTIGVQYPYKEAAYLFLNSLPLSTLREKYNSDDSGQLDYIFATLKKFGAVHRLPYTWILKYGAIWHRYKTWKETGTDFLSTVWTSTNYIDNYDPVSNSPTKTYTVPSSIPGVTDTIVLQDTTTAGGLSQTNVNVGFYPKLINDIFYFTTGLNLFTGYTDTDITRAFSVGLNAGYSRTASINEPVGVDSTNPLRTISSKSWYTTFSTQNNSQLDVSKRRKTIIFPSFGSTINQTKFELFNRFGNNFVLRPGQDIVNNSAVYDGSSRLFWGAPIYGYFDTTTQPLPPPDAYLTEITNLDSLQTALGILPNSQQYTKIEDIFGTFKKQILDDFETEFLNYCKDVNDIDIDFLGLNPNAKNFQVCLSSMLLVDEVSTDLDSENYIQNVSNSQVSNIGNLVKNLLDYNVTFKYGNPGEHNRQVFGTFSTPQVIDPITYAGYVANTLPSSSGSIGLVVSQAQSPQAWTAMYTNVGFSTIPGLVYTDGGSYYTDFFIDNNVEFTASNVQQFSTLIKIYGTQKLNNNGNYNSTLFNQDITNFNTQKDNYVSQVLTQLFFKLQRQLPTIDSVSIKPINSAVNGTQPKIEYWETFKAFNDKWIAGNDYREKTLFEDVMFLDRANRDIGDKVYFDIFKVKSYLFSVENQNLRVIDFLSQIIFDNRFYMMPMSSYINFWGINDVRPNVEPVPEGSTDLANSMFGTFTEVDTRMSSPKLVCFYAGKPSEHLDTRDNPDFRFKNDIFLLARASDNPLLDKLTDKTNWSQSNKVVGFNVDFGNRSQSMFYNIQIDQNQYAATTEANAMITEAVNAVGGRRTFTQNVGLFGFYKMRSYECQIESLGNAMIQPTMYFNLRHVPMFNGPYMIQSVVHNIDAGNFRTTFKGVRMPVYSLPKLDNQIASINQSLLSNLVSEIQRKRQVEQTTANPPTNITTVGNTIYTKGSYTPESSSTCNTSLSSTYENYVGVDSVEVKFNYAQIASTLKSLTTDTRVRASVFYTMYVNGVKENQFVGYNYNFAGAPLGGYLYDNINYGGLKTYFNGTYFCMNDGYYSRPYASFDNLQNFMSFMVDYYKTKVDLFNSAWNSGTLTYENYPSTMAAILIDFWPYPRFGTNLQNNKQLDDWFKNNESKAEDLTIKATETLSIMKTNNLL